MSDDPLALDAETMRRLGYRMVDVLVDRTARVASEPTIRTASREELERRLVEAPPEGPEDLDRILDRLATDVLPFAGLYDHPAFFAYIPGSGTWPAALADFMASALNMDAGGWQFASGLTQVELVVLEWFKGWIGYPTEAAGILVSGGSAANLTALACAREALVGAMSDRVIGYVSDQAHSSMARAARVLGFRPDQIRVLPSDDRFRLHLDALVGAIEADMRAGRKPMFVAAAAGSTNTGAVDPLPELAAICHERGLWLHVDAAYGGFAALTERGREWLAGLELADSVTLDPHKWLYQPFACGGLLVREGRQLRAAFEIVPEYMKDAHTVSREVSLSSYGMELTRAARALKVWVSIKYFGVGAFRVAIDRSLDLARRAEAKIESSDDLEMMTPASLGIVCFRRRFGGERDEDALERLNGELVRALAESGLGFVSSTRLRGRAAIRLCVLNHSSRWEDVERVLDWLEAAPVAGVAEARPPLGRSAQEAGVDQAWLRRPAIDSTALVTVPLFSQLTADDAVRVLELAQERRVQPGEYAVQQWEYAREFFVILEGSAEVRSGERQLRLLKPGDFFGELSALEWGAGFSYPRTASVRATSPLRLLVVPGALLSDLVRDVPGVGDQIRHAVRERLPKI